MVKNVLNFMQFLPPANEVWGKVIFLHLFVILFMGEGVPGPRGWGVPGRGVPGRGGLLRGGVPASGGGTCSQGCLLPGGAWSRGSAPGGGGVTAAGGTHFTGMHSCFLGFFFENLAKS